MARSTTPLTELARLGFADLDRAAEGTVDLPERLLPLFAVVADPDAALVAVGRLRERDRATVDAVLDDPTGAPRLLAVLGASEGLAAFLQRHMSELRPSILDPIAEPLTQEEASASVAEAVGDRTGEEAWCALRIRYRRELTRLAAWDLEAADPASVLDRVAAGLADLAGAALEQSLAIARRSSRFPPSQVADTRLAIIGMGKAGARELNYLSDVDVVFAGGARDGSETDDARAIEIATRLAMDAMRGIHELAAEPGLWEVDANLRPEGKDGALVRTLDSHVAYYERWAQGWEFQALLKARPLAGDADLGAEYVERIAPFVWSSSTRDGFVESVQRMRERVTSHIPSDEVDVQLKLGPGGLRDVEFTIQLLQLVHGHADPSVR